MRGNRTLSTWQIFRILWNDLPDEHWVLFQELLFSPNELRRRFLRETVFRQNLSRAWNGERPLL